MAELSIYQQIAKDITVNTLKNENVNISLTDDDAKKIVSFYTSVYKNLIDTFQVKHTAQEIKDVMKVHSYDNEW